MTAAKAVETTAGLRGRLEYHRHSREGGNPVDKQLTIQRNGKRQTNTTPAKGVALTRGHIGLDSRLRGNDVGVNSVSELVNIYNCADKTTAGLRGRLEYPRHSREGGNPVDKQLTIQRNGKRQTNTTPAKGVALTRGHIGLDSRLRGNDGPRTRE